MARSKPAQASHTASQKSQIVEADQLRFPPGIVRQPDNQCRHDHQNRPRKDEEWRKQPADHHSTVVIH